MGEDQLQPWNDRDDDGLLEPTGSYSGFDVPSGLLGGNNPAVVPELAISPYEGDETEVSTTNTTYTVVKSFTLTIDSTNLKSPNEIILSSEARNSTSGDTTYLALYIDGTQYIEVTTTNSGYTWLTGSADISSLADGLHNVELQMQVSASTGYNRLFEVFVR